MAREVTRDLYEGSSMARKGTLKAVYQILPQIPRLFQGFPKKKGKKCRGLSGCLGCSRSFR